jgi:hypothetical protein
MVIATAVPDMVPTAFRMTAITRASEGESTLVETTVAMAFAASCQPLTNSAQRMRKRTGRRGIIASGMIIDLPLLSFYSANFVFISMHKHLKPC